MYWWWLLLAGLLEVAWAIGLQRSEGFTRPAASVLTVLLMIASFWFLAQAQRGLPLGTAYAVWTGIGVLGTTVYGMIVLQEPRTALRIGLIGLILTGIVGLKLTSRNP